MADAGKYGNICMAKVADISDLKGVVADGELSPAICQGLMERGVTVL